ncbi:MAG: hypothetical protein IGS03_06635 [Candidatus Sericytochromatia bacterium]|nr:hypothetical protein [Candidatus Sericytochromatia bacterium]
MFGCFILAACSPLPLPAPAADRPALATLPDARPVESPLASVSATPTPPAGPEATAEPSASALPTPTTAPPEDPRLQAFVAQIHRLELRYPSLMVPYSGGTNGMQLSVLLLNVQGQILKDWPEGLQQRLRYSSSQPDVLAVDEQGRLRALQSAGNSRIRVDLLQSTLSAEQMFVVTSSSTASGGGGGGGGGGSSNGDHNAPPAGQREKIVGSIAFQF